VSVPIFGPQYTETDRYQMESNTLNKIDFFINPLAKGEYENCMFTNSSFLNADLADILFVECEFENCDLSMAKLTNTTLRDIKFKNCKLLGLRFDDCNEFGLSFFFENCNCSHASFFRTKLKKTIFSNLKLHDVDFTECDLTGSVFVNCDLAGALFDKTLLEKADFRTAFNFLIDPERNRIKKAKFSLAGIAGLLHKYDIDIEF
jgi:fluoroquinolone resistance protein